MNGKEDGTGVEVPIAAGSMPDAVAVALANTPSLREAEVVEGWIDCDEAPDPGYFVRFWNLEERALHSRRATLILHPEGTDD